MPWLLERSRRYRCNGLDTLERLGLIVREANGSSRRVSIAGRLRATSRAEKEAISPKMDPKPASIARDVSAAGRAREWWAAERIRLHPTVHEDAH